MRSFVYLLPGRFGASPAVLDELGLTPLLGRVVSYRERFSGPGDEPGVLVCVANANPSLKPDDYEWQKCNGGAYWVGCHKREKPRPEDLCTSSLHSVFPVEMGDGNLWDVPVLRTCAGELMPGARVLTLDDNDDVITRALDRYLELAQKTENLWKEFADRTKTVKVGEQEQVTIDFKVDDDFSIVCEALGLCYHVTKYEISVLGLLTPYAVVESLKAIIDFPTIMEPFEEDKASGEQADAQPETATAAAQAPVLASDNAPTPDQEG